MGLHKCSSKHMQSQSAETKEQHAEETEQAEAAEGEGGEDAVRGEVTLRGRRRLPVAHSPDDISRRDKWRQCDLRNGKCGWSKIATPRSTLLPHLRAAGPHSRWHL